MKNILLYISVFAVVLLLASCEDYLDVNTDPNNPTEVSPDLVLPVAQTYTANIIQRDRGINHLGNMMMYNWSQSDGFSWYNNEFLYLVTPSFYPHLFDIQFSSDLKQYNVLENLDSKYDNYKAISKIMKSFQYQMLVDLYGDIPYFEALGRSQNATPVYDDAQVIYEDLINQLDTAIILINSAVDGEVPDADDFIFGGNMDKWKKFANTVKLRILIRQSDMSGREGYIKAELGKIISEGSGFITTDVMVQPGYVKEQGKQNRMWNDLGEDVSGTTRLSGDATCATDYILEYLTNTNDPRIDYIYEEPADGHLGVPQGLEKYDSPIVDQFVPEKVSNIGPGILKGYDMGAVIFTMAECNFLQAEAAVKNLISDDAQTFYEAGITASFNYLGAEGAATYFGQTSKSLVNWGASDNKIEAIITQKWIALNGINAIQSWFDYSRTGYPSNLPISRLASTPDRPVRLFYPASELSTNTDNVPSQPDAFTSKIFWAK